MGVHNRSPASARARPRDIRSSVRPRPPRSQSAPPRAQRETSPPDKRQACVGALLSRCGEGWLGVSGGCSELGRRHPDMAPTHRQRGGAPPNPLRVPILGALKLATSVRRHRLRQGRPWSHDCRATCARCGAALIEARERATFGARPGHAVHKALATRWSMARTL